MRKVVILGVVLALAAFGCGKSGHAPANAKAPKPPAAASAGAPVVESSATASVEESPSSAVANSGLIEVAAPAGPLPAHLVGANPKPDSNEKPVDGGSIVMRLNAEPETLNPLTQNDFYAGQILGSVMDGLAGRNPDTLEWEPYLATSWDLTPDHLSYVFHLRRGVKWHDGAPFDADDVIYSYKTLMNPNVSAAPLRNYYQDLASIEKIDDYTVKYTWKKPYFMSFEFSAGLPIIPKHIFDNGENFNTHSAGRKPVGTGMYKFASWNTGEGIALERNEDYYGRKPHIKRLVFRFIPDDNNAILQASSGAVDDMDVTPEQWVTGVMNKPFPEKFNKYYYYEQRFQYIGWNELRPFFADKMVRRALTMLVNREGIVKNIYHDLAVVVTGPFYIYSDAYDPSIKPWPYDPAQARRILDEAGWKVNPDDGIREKVIEGKPVKLSFTFTYPAGRASSALVAALTQEEMHKAGIDVNIQQLEWAVFIQKLTERNFDAVTLGWSMGIEQDPYQIWHSSMIGGGGSNAIGFKNAEADRLIEEARPEFDRAKRTAMYHRFHALIHDEQPYTFLLCPAKLEIIDKRVHNVIVHRLGLDMRDWFIPKELQDEKAQ